MALSLSKDQRMNTAEGVASAPAAAVVLEVKVEQVQCECCGLVEECTPSYIAHVRGVYRGRWVCGLCGEAVKEELGKASRRLERVEEGGLEAALQAHMSFCMEFNNPLEKASSPVIHLAAAMRRLLRRSLHASFSAPNSPRRCPTTCISILPRNSCTTTSLQ